MPNESSGFLCGQLAFIEQRLKGVSAGFGVPLIFSVIHYILRSLWAK
jgi:hypothetical protein